MFDIDSFAATMIGFTGQRLRSLLIAGSILLGFSALPDSSRALLMAKAKAAAIQEAGPAVSETELTAYLRARPQVEDITVYWAGALENASATAAMGLRHVRDNEIEQAVKSDGLTLKRYRQIESLIKIDPDVQRKVESLMRE